MEEFDLPLEYGLDLPLEQQLQLGKKGWDLTRELIDAPDLRCTLFTTARFARYDPQSVKTTALRHEIASHTFNHDSFRTEDLLSSRQTLEEISGTKVTGLRMPRMREVAAEEVIRAGYRYDSSQNPTWIPGRYNNLNLPRTCHTERGLMRIPASVTPVLRIPLFWLSFKNLPYPVYKMLALRTLRKDGYLCLYFHPWEFLDLSSFPIPGYLRKVQGSQLLDRVSRLIRDLKTEGQFVSIQDYLNPR